MERRLLLDVIVGQSAAVLELLAREDQALLVRRDALLVLDLRLKDTENLWKPVFNFCSCNKTADT